MQSYGALPFTFFDYYVNLSKKNQLEKKFDAIGRRVVLPSEGEESLLDSFQAPADISQQRG